MPVCRSEILPLLERVGLSEDDAIEHSVPEPVLDDIAATVPLLPQGFGPPDIEIDDDGCAILRWFSPNMRASFSLTFLGLGSVGGYLSTERRDPAWKLPIEDGRRLAMRLSNIGVVEILRSPQCRHEETLNCGS